MRKLFNAIRQTKTRVALLLNPPQARHSQPPHMLTNTSTNGRAISRFASYEYTITPSHHGSYMPSASALTAPFVISTVHCAPLTNPVAVEPSSSFVPSPCFAVYEYVKPVPATLAKNQRTEDAPQITK